MKNSLLIPVALLGVLLTACNFMSEEEKRSVKALQAVNDVIELPEMGPKDTLFFWTGQLRDGEAIVMQVEGKDSSGKPFPVLAFWVRNGQVYPVTETSRARMNTPQTVDAPVTLSEVISAISDLPENARVQLEREPAK